MPLLDHFRPPLSTRRHWESFHVNWAGAIADALNDTLLPEGYFAEEHVRLGPRVEIDVAAFDENSSRNASPIVTIAPRLWTIPTPTFTVPAAFPEELEVLVFEDEGGAKLVAAIELVGPANKDRDAHRRAFAVKCGSYLATGIGLLVIDVVTTLHANLHNDLMDVLGYGIETRLPEGDLSAVAYRPIVRDTEQIDIWTAPLTVGEVLPTLPLAISADIALPIDLEATYTAARERRRLG